MLLNVTDWNFNHIMVATVIRSIALRSVIMVYMQDELLEGTTAKQSYAVLAKRVTSKASSH